MPPSLLPPQSSCSLPWDVSFCSIQSSQLLPSVFRHAFPHSLSSFFVVFCSPAAPLVQRGRLMPYPRPSQFVLTPLLGRATLPTWEDCGLCNGRGRTLSIPYVLPHSTEYNIKYSTVQCRDSTCTEYVLSGYRVLQPELLPDLLSIIHRRSDDEYLSPGVSLLSSLRRMVEGVLPRSQSPSPFPLRPSSWLLA